MSRQADPECVPRKSGATLSPSPTTYKLVSDKRTLKPQLGHHPTSNLSFFTNNWSEGSPISPLTPTCASGALLLLLPGGQALPNILRVISNKALPLLLKGRKAKQLAEVPIEHAGPNLGQALRLELQTAVIIGPMDYRNLLPTNRLAVIPRFPAESLTVTNPRTPLPR